MSGNSARTMTQILELNRFVPLGVSDTSQWDISNNLALELQQYSGVRSMPFVVHFLTPISLLISYVKGLVLDYDGDVMNFPTSSSQSARFKFPEWRRMQKAALKTMFATVRDNEKLADNAFDAITLIAASNPDKVFWYEIPNS